ncbi:MAG: hypothetical protein NDJ72_05230 [Elusimicrobia bacterium]|nr:hypothetical protein [Elusimicrobiota bacterium]
MHFKTLALVLGLSASAHAQVVYKLPTTLGNIAPVVLPGRPVMPMILPTVDAVIAVPAIKPVLNPTAFPVIAPISLPVYPVPAIGPVRLPGVPSPLPLPTPAALAAARRPAPSSVEEPFFINWSLLDDKGGDEAAAAMVPNDPGPRPLAPAGALNELRDLANGRDPIRMTPVRLFDGGREKLRDLELPSNKYF